MIAKSRNPPVKKSSKKKKSFENFNAKDLHEYWELKYKEHYNEEYFYGGYIGYEMQMLRESLDNYGIYEILLGIDACLNDGVKYIRYFYNSIEHYIPKSIYSKYYYLISNSSKDSLKQEILKLKVLESKLLPTAKTKKDIIAIIEKLDIFLEVKLL